MALLLRQVAHRERVPNCCKDWRSCQCVKPIHFPHTCLEVQVQKAKEEEHRHQAREHKRCHYTHDDGCRQELQEALEPRGGVARKIPVDVSRVLGKAVDDAAGGLRVEEGERRVQQRGEHVYVKVCGSTQTQPPHLILGHNCQKYLQFIALYTECFIASGKKVIMLR
jgi:hypothetical protein